MICMGGAAVVCMRKGGSGLYGSGGSDLYGSPVICMGSSGSDLYGRVAVICTDQLESCTRTCGVRIVSYSYGSSSTIDSSAGSTIISPASQSIRPILCVHGVE